MRRNRVRGIGVLRSRLRLIRENRFEAAGLALIMQKDHGHHAKRLLARVALRYLTLKILQKTVGKVIERTLAAGIFLVVRAAVGTDELNFVLLRIAVQSGPTRAAHANNFHDSPLHRIYPLMILVHVHVMR